MPCRVAERWRVISGSLRKRDERRDADGADAAVLHRRDAIGEGVDAGVVCDDDNRAVRSDFRISSTVWPDSASSAAVGSSQTTSRGAWTNARAIATRCCWPPESWLGNLPRCAPTPMRSRIAAVDPAARAIGMPAATSGIAAFSAAVSAGNKLYC